MTFSELTDAEQAYFLLAFGETMNVNPIFKNYIYDKLATLPAARGFSFNYEEITMGTMVERRLAISINGRSISENFAASILRETSVDCGSSFLGNIIWGRNPIRFGSDIWTFATLLRDIAAHPEGAISRIFSASPGNLMPELIRANSAYMLGELIVPGLVDLLFGLHCQSTADDQIPRLTDVMNRAGPVRTTIL